MRVSVVLGAGHHGPEVLEALRRRAWLHRAIHVHPRFLVEDGERWALARARWADLSLRALWASWRRVPVLGRREAMRGASVALMGTLAARHVDRFDLLVAWLQVGLESLRKAHRAGAATLLEHPMNHILHYDGSLSLERERWGRALGGNNDFPALVRRRMLAEYAEARSISVLSSFSKRTFLEHGVPADRLIEIPLGVDHVHFAPDAAPAVREGSEAAGPARARRPGPLRVLYVGRVELLKGVPYLLEAMKRLRGAAVELAVVGGVAHDLEPLLRRFDDARISYRPPVSRAELPAVYRAADVLVFPSLNDAFGLVMLEAMACGLPVIATDHSGAVDVIRDGVDGFVVPARDPAAIAARLEPLIADPSLAAEMGRLARQRIAGHYTLDHHAGRLADVCRRLALAPPNSR
jgi:glycosyltransferase involved in cell wall biosynthesis